MPIQLINTNNASSSAPTGGSLSFSGTNYVSVANSASLNPGTGDFTLEFWTYLNSTTNNASFWRGNNNGVDVFMNGTSKLSMGQAQVSTKITDSVNMTTGSWVHVAVARSSSTTRLFKNGALVGSSGGDTTNYVVDSINYIGNQGTFKINGYISNLRMVIGSALYTGSFTVPTSPLTAIAGTQLLLNTTNDADFLKDSSTNNFTVTNNGSVTSASTSPFLAFESRNFSLINKTNSGRTSFESAAATGGSFVNPSLTIGSAVTVVAQSPFTGGGNSYQFSSNVNSFIDTPGSSDWALGTGDFTIEWFARQTSTASFPRAFSIGTYSTATIANSIESGTFYYWANSGVRYSNSSGTTLNTWVHWAIVRQSNVTKIYKDGTQLGSQVTDNNNITNTSTALTIGNETTKSISASLVGTLTNLRWVKGLAVYTGNFTKPTSALTATASANPYGGSNTQAIGSGFTKLLLIP
jgi:hypothetical protein